MGMSAEGTLVGLVFRRVLGPDERERARRLVETVGATAPSADGVGLTWYGLHDLAAPGAEDLVGVAVTGGRGPETAELVLVAVPPGLRRRGLRRRLVREVADVLRGEGAERLVAVPTGHDGAWLALLEDTGFTPVDAAPPSAGADGPSWRLEL